MKLVGQLATAIGWRFVFAIAALAGIAAMAAILIAATAVVFVRGPNPFVDGAIIEA